LLPFRAPFRACRPGTLSLCGSKLGIKSLVKALQLDPSNNKVTNHLLALLFEIFRIPLPPWTPDFTTVLESMKAMRQRRLDQQRQQQTSATAFSKRPDLLHAHTAIQLAALLDAGLCDALIQLAVTLSDTHLSVRAAALLGELHAVGKEVLPAVRLKQFAALPALLAIATSHESSLEKRSAAKLAANYLEKVRRQHGALCPVPCARTGMRVTSRLCASPHVLEGPHHTCAHDAVKPHSPKEPPAKAKT